MKEQSKDRATLRAFIENEDDSTLWHVLYTVLAKWWKEIQSAHGATPTPTEPSAYRHHQSHSAPSMSPTADGSGPWIGSKHTLGSPAGHFMYIIVPHFG